MKRTASVQPEASNIGALIVRTGFGVYYYTMLIIRNPQNLILIITIIMTMIIIIIIIKAPALGGGTPSRFRC